MSNSVEEQKSFFQVIVHSFFVIPFLIAVFSVLLFVGMRILTTETRTVYDYLEDVRTGGLTKRWQSAFELSKILANPDLVPKDEGFIREMSGLYRQAQHDDPRVRQYLALAMGRTGNPQFIDTLKHNIKNEQPENQYAILYALGLLKQPSSLNVVIPFATDSNPRLRLAAISALGNIDDARTTALLRQALTDEEPNVQWEAAVALAKRKDSSGKEILSNLLTPGFLANYPQVDAHEQVHITIVALKAAGNLNDSQLDQQIQNIAASHVNLKIRKEAQDIYQGRMK